MRDWALWLGGLLVWAAHFFAIYAIGSLFPGMDVARPLVLAATAAAILADLLLLRVIARRRGMAERDEVDRWSDGLAGLGAVLSLIAVVWQGLPAILV